MYASNVPNQDTEPRHAEGKQTIWREQLGNQKPTTRSNGGHQPKHERWRLKEEQKKSRETTKVPSKQWSEGHDQTKAH